MFFGFGGDGGERLLCGHIFLLHIHLPNSLLRRSAFMAAAFPVTAAVYIEQNIILYRVIHHARLSSPIMVF